MQMLADFKIKLDEVVFNGIFNDQKIENQQHL
jgi:hypothetical protein